MATLQSRTELDAVCSLLGDEYRRRVLRLLGNASGPMTRDELARAVARDGRRTESTEQVEMSLHHVHLPKLADENAIRYEADAVAITEYGERLLGGLDALERGLAGQTNVR